MNPRPNANAADRCLRPSNRSSCRGLDRIPQLLLLAWLTGRTGAVELPRGFVEETLATNLNAVTAMAVGPDNRVWIAEQTGLVRLWKAGRLVDQPVLRLPVTDYWERGLIGLTLDPGFPEKPFLYVLYVTDRPFVHHVLSRIELEGDTAVPGSAL